MRSGVFSVIACSAACAKIEPQFDFEPLVTVVENGNERRVIGPEYEMVFHGGQDNEIHMPESLLIKQGSEQIETLGLDSQTCNHERQVGFALYPTLAATADTKNTVIESSITTNDDGPFVAQINAHMVIEHTCPNSHEFRADATFTFFPNGRIVRHDFSVQAIETGTLVKQEGECGPCGQLGPNDSFFFTSFWALDVAGRNFDRQGNALEGNSPLVPGACTLYPTHGIGVQFNPLISRVAPGGSNAQAYVLDFETGTSVSSNEREAFSAIQIAGKDNLERGDCETILAQLAEPAIRVGMNQLPNANVDGIYDDEQEHDAPFDIEVIGNDIVPSGWAFATTFFTDIVKITRDPPSENDLPVAYVQRFEPDLNRFLFVFTDSLGPGVKIHFEPQ